MQSEGYRPVPRNNHGQGTDSLGRLWIFGASSIRRLWCSVLFVCHFRRLPWHVQLQQHVVDEQPERDAMGLRERASPLFLVALHRRLVERSLRSLVFVCLLLNRLLTG